VALAEESVERTGIADVALLRASRLIDFERRLVAASAAILYLVIAYTTITFVLRRFPFTRPWGESMRGFLIATATELGLGIAKALPGIVTIVIIFLLARFVARMIAFWFDAITRGRIASPRWLHAETAVPTRRLLTALVWLFAAVSVYPYVPGSQTDAFKGISVLAGLMLTLGSSGLITQIMSSFVITYSRALRVGHFVRVGEIEGTVTQLGLLSTKIRTVWSEEVTIPNALVVSQTTTDYSRLAGSGSVFMQTSVTIGYDTPWRQVHSLLLAAAARTPGVRQEPKPFVLQTALQDFYVQYTLSVSLEEQDSRPFTAAALHANIQDLFNEYSVQIMSPHYMIDPAAPKIVPRQNWFAAPASAEMKGAGAISRR
jgi:small-conductance mechanosensitive channel